MEVVQKKMNNYFYKTYKRLDYQDFIETNDYHIQNIKLFIEAIQKGKNLDINRYGQCLQNFILSMEKPIMMAVENNLLKSAVSK